MITQLRTYFLRFRYLIFRSLQNQITLNTSVFDCFINQEKKMEKAKISMQIIFKSNMCIDAHIKFTCQKSQFPKGR